MMDIGFRTLVCLPREDDIADLLKNLKNHFPSFNFSGTVVLNKVNYLGNTENHNMFHDMRLENRAQALYCCIFLWRSFVKEIGFVLGLKPYCKEKCVHDGSNMCDKTKLLVFSWSSFKTKVSALAMEVKKCSHLLIDRFSDISLSDDDIQNLNKLTRGISHLENQMQNCDITHSNVERIFGLGSGLGFDLEGIGFYITELNETRMNCLGLIEIVVNSIELPQLNDRKEFEEFCIKHSRTIICTPACSSQLHDLKLDSIDILLVDDAGQIRESDMLMPLSFSPRHIVMLGDHLHIQPMVKSEVCQDAGFGSSLFQRLSHIYSQKKILCKQYMINPSISQFMNEHFYEGRLEDGWIVKSDGYNNLLKKFPSYTYGFFDISAVDELREKGNFFVESAAVMGLLQSLCKGLTNDTGKINVGMVCLSYSKMDEMQNFLGIKYENHERINVEVSSLDNLSQKWYDVVILSSVFDDKSELPEGNKINVALTKSRHCLWIIGEAVKLGASGDTWQKLIANAKERRCCAKLNSKVLAKVMRQSEAYHQDRDRSTAANSALPKNIMQKDFTWTLSLSNLKSQYEHTVAGEFASEETKERGKRRLETALDILKDHGVIGHHKVEFEVKN
uniref:DNA2/NAM7 helicase-like C-terminal domain-containing protein n=1 Tax=Oryza brachyantha TaxID=4533 RepID=J3N9W6_ORYBR